MTYSEFKEFILRFLWRAGDTQLSSDLDVLIAAANARLTRDMRVPRMTVTAYAFSMLAHDADLPDDFRRPLTIRDADTGQELKSTSASNIADLQAQSLVDTAPFYCIVGRTIRVAGGTIDVSTPLNLLLDYQAKVPDFATTDATWLIDEGEYTDLYLAAVLAETPAYLRNDVRTGLWRDAYKEKLDSVNSDTATLEWGAPLVSAMPSGVR